MLKERKRGGLVADRTPKKFGLGRTAEASEGKLGSWGACLKENEETSALCSQVGTHQLGATAPRIKKRWVAKMP